MSRRSRFMHLIRTRSGFAEIIRVYSAPYNNEAAARKEFHVPSVETSPRRPVIFLSELDYVSRCILDYPNIETGGQLFGYWTEEGVPVVMYAIGPGMNANHQVTFFNQDVEYLLRAGNELRNRYGLQHIGEWHSHHRLSLARPSGHDANTMVSTIREKNLGRFLLCIGNTDGATTTFNPFMCDSRECIPASWEIIMADSPVRVDADGRMKDTLIHPRTRMPSHSDARLRRTRSVRFPLGYWLNEESGRDDFNALVSHFKVNGSQSTVVSSKVDENGFAHIVRDGVIYHGEKARIDMLFPLRFPVVPPQVTVMVDGKVLEAKCHTPWEYGKYDVYEAVIRYETTSVLSVVKR